MNKVRFIKMEGCGNDYVFLDGLTGESNGLPKDIGPLARKLSDRHHGIGSDGLILLLPGDDSPVRMRMWNADGSEGRLCLNGLRCAARYAAEELELDPSFVVETAAGDRKVTMHRDAEGRVEEVEVEVGPADYRRAAIPALGEDKELWGDRFYVGGMDLAGYGLSVGNPHLVLWMEEEEAVWRAPLEDIGEPFNDDLRFPEGINVHLVSASPGRGILMRSWERGSGITQACGTGAVAAFAVANRLKAVGSSAVVRMPGGSLRMSIDDSGRLIMRGPAREVFRGECTVESHG